MNDVFGAYGRRDLANMKLLLATDTDAMLELELNMATEKFLM